MLTPSGRYEVNKEICLTNSRYHKGEWSSTWNIKTILIAFYSIFLDDTTTGISHIHKSDAERKVLAKGAIDYNKKFHNDIYTKFNFTHISDSAPITKKEEIVNEVKLEVKQEIVNEAKLEVKQEIVNEAKLEVKQELVNEIVKEEIKQVIELVENTNVDLSLSNSTKIKDLNNKIEKQFEYIKSLEEELNI
jgi:predicted transcriptional regulator